MAQVHWADTTRIWDGQGDNAADGSKKEEESGDGYNQKHLFLAVGTTLEQATRDISGNSAIWKRGTVYANKQTNKA